MVIIYTCNLCNKKFKNNTDYNRHMNRKFTCNKNMINLLNDKISKFICNKCDKIFTRKYNLDRHVNICNNKLIGEKILLKEILEENIRLKKMILELNDKILKKNLNNTNITNNIIIQYGCEYKTEGLHNEEIIRIVNKGWTALYESIKLTHFNSRLPQLHNIYIPDKKFNTIMILKNKKFELDKLENILYDLIDKHIDNIKQYLDMDLNFQENKLPTVKKLLDKISEIYDNDNFYKFKNDEHISEILFFLYNNRELVIKNYVKYC